MDRPAGISLVLPAYNEEQNLAAVIESAVEASRQLDREFEVIVVDDGSRDRTAEVATALVNESHPQVRLLRHPVNYGYGAALRTGMQHARFDLVFYTDADRQFDIGEIAYFLPLIEQYDIVVGFRVYRYDSVLRSILSWVYNKLVRIMFRVKVRDVDCAFKLMRREVLDRLDLESNDFFFDTELLARARKWNFSIAQKGVRHYPRVAGETTVRASDIPRTLRTVGRMWKRIYMPSASQRQEGADQARRILATEVPPVPAGKR